MAWNLKINTSPQVKCDRNGIAASAGLGLPGEMARPGDKASSITQSLEMREV